VCVSFYFNILFLMPYINEFYWCMFIFFLNVSLGAINSVYCLQSVSCEHTCMSLKLYAVGGKFQNRISTDPVYSVCVSERQDSRLTASSKGHSVL
jgi:hypothetical protein